jgi:superfamily II DNA or RNA helicase
MKDLNSIKNAIQTQVHTMWVGAGSIGTICAATGFGKSRLAVMEVQRLAAEGLLQNKDEVLLVTPTTKLRDENWPNEFKDWGAEDLFKDHVKAICFASLKNELGNNKQYKFIILDEIHRITQMNAAAFEETGEDVLTSFSAEVMCDKVLGLTATVPDPDRDPVKARIIAQIAPVIFTYSLDQAVKDGMVADYEIRVIEATLNNRDKTISAGTKAKPFMTTEAKQYEYLEKQIKRWRILENNTSNPMEAAKYAKLCIIAQGNRNRFLYNCQTKTDLGARIIKHATGDKRTLVFCGSIEQCDKLLGEKVFHSKVKDVAYKAFNSKEINILGVVNAANEGINFVDLDQLYILQLDSNERNLVQRIGRSLRVREGHKARIYILVVKDTADERWYEKVIADFDKSKISYYSDKSVPL